MNPEKYYTKTQYSNTFENEDKAKVISSEKNDT